MQKAVAIILAAGNGTRLAAKSGSKAFLKIGKETLLSRVVRMFETHPKITELVVVVRSRDKEKIVRILKAHDTVRAPASNNARAKKPIAVVSGGRTRQQSAYAAVQYLDTRGTSCDTVLVFHNVANPFVTHEEITRVIAACNGETRAAAVAHAITDTVKRVRHSIEHDTEQRTGKDTARATVPSRASSEATSTLPRGELYRTQTPQAMRLGTALNAHAQARTEHYEGTDDVELVERLGKQVILVPASPYNFKITTREDLKLAQSIINLINNEL